MNGKDTRSHILHMHQVVDIVQPHGHSDGDIPKRGDTM